MNVYESSSFIRNNLNIELDFSNPNCEISLYKFIEIKFDFVKYLYHYEMQEIFNKCPNFIAMIFLSMEENVKEDFYSWGVIPTMLLNLKILNLNINFEKIFKKSFMEEENINFNLKMIEKYSKYIEIWHAFVEEDYPKLFDIIKNSHLEIENPKIFKYYEHEYFNQIIKHLSYREDNIVDSLSIKILRKDLPEMFMYSIFSFSPLVCALPYNSFTEKIYSLYSEEFTEEKINEYYKKCSLREKDLCFIQKIKSDF